MATILIVDDNAANRELLVVLLRHHGHRMLEAADGKAALDVIRADPPDLVITDVLMPVMDGYELVRQLRLDVAISGIPVVFCTAHYGEREARALALASGVSWVLTKPVDLDEVLRVVVLVLSGASETGERPSVNPLTPEFDREHLRLVTDKLSESRDELRTRNTQLRALVNIGLELASERDSNRLLDRVANSARELFDATYVTLGILDRDDRTLRHMLTRGLITADWIETGDSLSGILATVVSERHPLRGVNASGDPVALQLPRLHPPIRTFMAAPIASPSHVYGWICLVRNPGRAFTEVDEQLLTALSGQVGRVYENGYYYNMAKGRADELEHEIAERKKAEWALRQERDRAQLYLDTADVILLALDMAGRITLVNRHACAVLGWTAEELLGREFIAVCVPVAIRPEIRDKLQEVQLGDDSIVESLVLTRSGTERLIEWRTSFLRDGDRRIIGTLSSGTDITDRKQAEAARRASEERYRALFEYAPDGILIADRTSTYLDANASICQMLGYSHDELVGMHGRDIVVPTEVQHIGKALHEITATHDYRREWRFRRKDGSEFTAEVIARGMPDGNLLAMVHDLTERIEATEALRAVDERMRFALQSANVGIWDMDYRTGRHTWSETLEAQYGLAPGTFEGTLEAFIDRIHPDDRTEVGGIVEKATRLGTDFSVLHRTIRPDGTVRWLNGIGRVHLGAHGEPVRALGISLDVTESHTLEEQYHQAQKMEAIGRLAGGVAHDFNNLLTAILGYCEMLLTDVPKGDPRHDDIAEIQKAGMSAAGLTRQLLAFSRKQIIEPTLLDLNTVVSGMRAIIGRLIGEDVAIALALHPAPARIKADRGQLEQILLNLAVNARDAMPMGGTLTIETANVELDEHYARTHLSVAPGRYVALTVTDTGTGMTPEVQARLFEPFFTTKEVGKGTGLGLATIHGIVARSGGSVNVYSEVGRGTAFKVYFPSAEAEETGAAVVPEVAQPHLAGHTILVVDDAEPVRELARRFLERLGYTVLVAATVEDAEQLFLQSPSIDLLLTDVVMPGISGPELTKRLTAERPTLKVVYMSGYTAEAIVKHGVLNPGIAFLHKPFTSDALGRKVRETLGW